MIYNDRNFYLCTADLLKLLNDFYRRTEVRRLAAESGLDGKHINLFSFGNGQQSLSLLYERIGLKQEFMCTLIVIQCCIYI